MCLSGKQLLNSNRFLFLCSNSNNFITKRSCFNKGEFSFISIIECHFVNSFCELSTTLRIQFVDEDLVFFFEQDTFSKYEYVNWLIFDRNWCSSCGCARVEFCGKKGTHLHTLTHIFMIPKLFLIVVFFLLSEYQIEMNVLKIFRYQEYSQYTTVCDNTFALLRTIYINKHEKIDILFCCCEFSVTLSFLNWHI